MQENEKTDHRSSGSRNCSSANVCECKYLPMETFKSYYDTRSVLRCEECEKPIPGAVSVFDFRKWPSHND